MGRVTKWISFEIDISDSTTISDEVDLEGSFMYAVFDIPTIDSQTLTVYGAQATGGTFKAIQIIDPTVGDNNALATAAGTGGFFLAVPIYGFRYLKLVSGGAQTADRTFYVRGVDYMVGGER